MIQLSSIYQDIKFVNAVKKNFVSISNNSFNNRLNWILKKVFPHLLNNNVRRYSNLISFTVDQLTTNSI